MNWKAVWIALIFLVPISSVAQTSSLDWVHFQAEHLDRSDTVVRVNLPARVVIRSFPLLPDLGCDSFGALAGESGISARDLGAIASRLSAVAAGETIEHDAGDYDVEATSTDGEVVLRFREKFSGDPVEVSMSTDVLRILSAGDHRRPDLAAAVAFLAAAGGGELARIDTEDSRIRIWVDRDPQARKD